ncbi:MAG: hypothetical protein IJ600_12875 [Lachnospiraceae bacterium]|nr:hypothetical protein [Lachnospiraceae bacterium]
MGILIVLPIAAAIAILDRRKIEEFLFAAIGIIIIPIIAAGIYGNTIPGVYIGVALGIIAFIYCLVTLVRDRERFVSCVFTPGLLAFMLCSVVSAFLFIGTSDLGSDNDSFWEHAPQILNMYRYSNLGNVGTRLYTYRLLHTAPTYTSWCYFCNKLWYCYSDGINMWARYLFSVAAMVPLFSMVGKKEGKKFILLLLFITIIPRIVDKSYNFMPDIPMGAALIYGTVMTISFFRSKEKYNDVWYLLGICIWIPLIALMKRVGSMYLYGILGIAVVYTLDRLSDKEQKAHFVKKIYPMLFMYASTALTLGFSTYRYTYFEKEKFYTALPFVAMGLFLAFGIFCHQVIKCFRTGRYIAMMLLLVSFFVLMLVWVQPAATVVIEMEGRNEAGGIKEVFVNFFKMWFIGGSGRFRTGWDVSDSLFALILGGGLLALRVLVSRDKISFSGTKEDIDNTICPVFVGYTVFMMFYCFLYMYRKNVYYAGDGGFNYCVRYLGPALMLTAGVVVYELLQIKGSIQGRVLMCAVAFFAILLPFDPFSSLGLERHTGWEKYEELYKSAGLELGEDDRVLGIGPDHVQYYAFPAISYRDDYAALKNLEMDAESLRARVVSRKYNYLILEDWYGNFPDKYQELFEGGKENIHKMAVYDVVIDGENVKFVLR